MARLCLLALAAGVSCVTSSAAPTAAVPWKNQIPDASVFTTGLDRSTHWFCHAKTAAAAAASHHGVDDAAATHDGHGDATDAAAGAHRRRTRAQAARRRLSATAAAGGGGHGTVCPDTCEALAHPHSYLALIFLFFALFLGCVAEYVHHHMVHYRFIKVITTFPYTTILMFIGILIGVIHSATRFDCAEHTNMESASAPPVEHHYRSGLGYLGDSIQMWLDIDSHLLLFTFLPALLFGDAIGLNWYTVKQCIWQCLVLAIVGVLIGASLTALYAKYVLPYGWDWDACFMFGSILSATDPVAVVGLLKEVGAKGSLTMQIAGESMFNDGVAIVLYSGLLNHVLKKPYLRKPEFTQIDPTFSYTFGQSGSGYTLNDTAINAAYSAAHAYTMDEQMKVTSDTMLMDDGWFITYLFVLFVKMFFGGVLVGLMFGKATQLVMASTNSVSNHIDGTLQIAMTFICAYLR